MWIACLIGLLCATATAQPEAKRIYLAPDDHTDYMWAADEATYRQAFLEMLDYYLNQMDATAGNPPQYQSRWNCDGSFWVNAYEENRSESEVARLVGRIRDGHLNVTMNTLISCYGGQPTEAVLRGMYNAGRIERKYNVRLEMAMAMENQTLPFGLGSLWAGCGAKYSWYGICGCASKVSDANNREHEIYWWEGLDGSRILMKWNSMFHGNTSMGGYAEAYNISQIVNFLNTDIAFMSRYPYGVTGAFGRGWDGLKLMDNRTITTAQNNSTTTCLVIVSNEKDFFEDFNATYGNAIPTQSCGFGNEWDLYSASMAEVSASVRRSVEKLRGAEALATLVSLKKANFMQGREGARNQAWVDLGLYWEHDWTADGSVSANARVAWQRRLAGEIKSYVDTLQTDATLELAGMIRKGASGNTRYFVFNPLSWTRTDVADLPSSDTTPVHVVDVSTDVEAPSQILTVEGVRTLRILARDIPPAGYKVFEIRPGAGGNFTNAAIVGGKIIENEFYQVTVDDRGAITSLIDKERGGREFSRTIGGLALNDLGPGSGTVSVENEGPVSVTLLATGSAPLQHTTRISLLRGMRRIEIRNEIEQNFGDVRAWAFGFNLNSPDVWHEEIGAVIRARYLAEGGHYSPRCGRYDWLSLNHFADMSEQGGAGVGVTLSSADCAFMKLGQSAGKVLDEATPQISLLAGGQVDGPGYGIPNQGGDSYFLQRFALQTHDAYSQADAMRFALEHQNPLLTARIVGGDAYPETAFSLLTLSDPDVLLWSLKPAEEGIGQGMIARLWNQKSAATTLTLALPLDAVASAQRLTHLETSLDAASTQITEAVLIAPLAPQQIGTFLIKPQGGVAVGLSFLKVE